MFAVVSFLVLNSLIAGLTWWRSRRSGANEYFLGRRQLSAPLVALSLLMTNFSTEQLIGLNGDAFRNGVSALAWEVFGAIGIVAFAAIFLPRYYAQGVTTIPQFVEQRCGCAVRRMMSLLMLLSLCVVGVPFVLYSGTLPLAVIFQLPERTGLSLGEVQSLTAFALGFAGLGYSLLGGMRGVALSDFFYAVIFLFAAALVPVLGLYALGEGSFWPGIAKLVAARPAALNPFGGVGQELPPSALLTGMLVINLSAWCANQGHAQKAFAASSLVEGQKGMFLAATIKLIAPVFFVLPGLIAWVLLDGEIAHADLSYAWLVQNLLPDWLTGFFAAAVAGAIITSVSGLLHSATSLFAIDLLAKENAQPAGRLAPAARWFSIGVVALAVAATPIIAQQQTGFFVLMKRLNATLTIPVAAVTLVAVLTRFRWPRGFVPAIMVLASATYLVAELVLRGWFPKELHWLHSVAIAFGLGVGALILTGRRDSAPRETVACVNWRHTKVACIAVLLGAVAIYAGLWLIARLHGGAANA